MRLLVWISADFQLESGTASGLPDNMAIDEDEDEDEDEGSEHLLSSREHLKTFENICLQLLSKAGHLDRSERGRSCQRTICRYSLPAHS